MEIVLAGLLTVTGILAAAFTTVYCLVRHAREERDRQLFYAYVHSPRDLETWLVRGALEHIQHALTLEDSARVPARFPARR